MTVYAKANGLLYSKDDAGTETALGGAGGGGAGNGLIYINPVFSDPVSITGAWTGVTYTDIGADIQYTRAYQSSGTQNDELSWDMWLDAGTYTASFIVRKSSNTGIITLKQSTSSMGTVDTYAAAPALATISITGWTVSATAQRTMQIILATKNGSSSGYYLGIYAVIIRRTA